MSLYSTALQSGGTVLVRRRFSVSHFWPDVQAWRVTVFQYVGEVVRYLTNVAPVPGEKDHTLRMIMGSGIGIDVWQRFKPVSYTHLRAHETVLDLVCRLLLEKKKKQNLEA